MRFSSIFLNSKYFRTEDSVLYGYQSGETEVYFHQAAGRISSGLPAPTDKMGTIIDSAKRLERDHSLILF